ncbi:MAG: ATP-binding protein [Methylotetracoccus sp.]
MDGSREQRSIGNPLLVASEREASLTPCPFSPHFSVPVEQAWRSLGLFVAYRIGLGLLLAVPAWLDSPFALLSVLDGRLFIIAASAYLGSAILGLPLLWRRKPAFAAQVHFQILADVCAISALMAASGGVASGLGILLACTVAAGGILTGGRCSVGFAALASIGVLVQDLTVGLNDPRGAGSSMAAGLLGAAFFAIALLAIALSRRAEQSHLIAARRTHDLANLRHLNEFIVEHLQSGIIVLDAGHRIQMANPAAQRLLGLNAPLIHLDQVGAMLRNAYFDWLNGETSEDTLHASSGPDGQSVQVRFARMGPSEPVLRMVLLEDNALHKQRVQRSKLDSLARLAASMAHEIRNPLSAIHHASQLLNESAGLAQEDRGLLDIVLKHTRRVNEIIENILQISRRHSSHRTNVDLGPWLSRFLSDFAEEHQLAPSPFVLSGDGRGLRAMVDPSHLKQILDNLCSNALKYGDPGKAGIEVMLRRDPVDSRPCIDVIDHGGGVEPSVAEQIFEPFFTTSRAGNGVGLYIARELAELNQARVEYRPWRDGSCFRVVLADGSHVAVEL